MNSTPRGQLILKTVPTEDAAKKVVLLLLEFAKTASADELAEKVRNTPYALSNDIAAEKAALFIEAFQKCGATAVFIPHEVAEPAVEQFTSIEKPLKFSFETSPTAQKADPPIQMKPKKNGVRRFIMMLVLILLILSVGFLTWQLWPIIGVKLQELINFLKHNI